MCHCRDDTKWIFRYKAPEKFWVRLIESGRLQGSSNNHDRR